VYSADPRVVPAAARIGTLSYEETQEMAEAGAKVLNAQAVEFAKERGIAIYARATQGPLPGADPASDGTVVRKSAPRMPGTVVGVASERDVLVLDATAPPTDVLALLADRGVPGKQLHVFHDRTTVVISRENMHDEGQFRQALETRLGGRGQLVDGLAAVSAIGAGINATYDNVRAGAATLSDVGIVVAGTATSSFRITWMVPDERVKDGVRALHERFIEKQRALLP
jgi:aspartate kinase